MEKSKARHLALLIRLPFEKKNQKQAKNDRFTYMMKYIAQALWKKSNIRSFTPY